jgi:hypothetical protein
LPAGAIVNVRLNRVGGEHPQHENWLGLHRRKSITQEKKNHTRKWANLANSMATILRLKVLLGIPV